MKLLVKYDGDGHPAAMFKAGNRKGDSFSFRNENGELYQGVLLSTPREAVNAPGTIRFTGLFEKPDASAGARLTVTKTLDTVDLS